MSTGTMPWPPLPVLSASSCSSQAPTSSSPGPLTIVTLSRPALQASPSAMPSWTPGLVSGGVPAAQDRTIRLVAFRNASRSTPMAAAGTTPKFDSTE